MIYSRRKNKRDIPHDYRRRSDDEKIDSSFGNENTSKYLNDTSLRMTKSPNYKDKQQGTMKSVKPNKGASKDDSPELIGEFELDSGEIEVGYDGKKKDTVVSFLNNNSNQASKEIWENSAYNKLMYSGERVRGSARKFDDPRCNALALRCGKDKSQIRLREQIDKVSKDNNYDTALNEVIPFNNIEFEKQKIEELRKLKNSNGSDRANIHNAITSVETIESQKEQKKLNFVQKITKAVKDVQESAKRAYYRRDDWLIYLKKKLELMRLFEKRALGDYNEEDIDNESEFKKEFENTTEENLNEKAENENEKEVESDENM